MKLILCTNRAGWLLRLWMWSRWSHSAILDEAQGVVYDSTLLGGGVRRGPMGAFLQHYSTFEMRDIEIQEGRLEEARAWLRAQLGKPYDWTALLGMPMHRNWQEDDAWFCSELTEMFIALFATPRFRESVSRITPYHQGMLV